MYLTPEWSEQRYGETIFFEENKKKKKRKASRAGDEQYETISKLICTVGGRWGGARAIARRGRDC